jgi:colicin import membrane protein
MKKGQKLPYAEKKFSLWLIGAAAMHVFVLFLAVSFQLWDAGRHPKPKIVTVTLVSSPGSATSREYSDHESAAGVVEAPSPAVAPPPPVSKKSVKEPVPEKSPVIEKKIAIEPLKPKVVEKKPDINQALLRLKENVDKKTAQLPKPATTNLSNALDRLQQKVKSSGEGAGTGSGRGQASSSAGRNGVGRGSGGGGTADSYKAKIASIIQQNWAFSKQLLKNSYGMEVYVRINIVADGTIRQILYDKRAPSEYLNNSVKKALEKSSPLPVLPKEEGARDVWIGFVFTPEGIE